MILESIGLALLGTAYIWRRYKDLCEKEDWLRLTYLTRFEITSSDLIRSRHYYKRHDYHTGIPGWNPAMMIACGFDPKYYRPRDGDADNFFGASDC